MLETFPAVIVGGGPAGAAAALALAGAGRRVMLLDDSAAGACRIGEALPAAARPLLRDLGLLEGFLADGHLPCYGNLSAWGSPHLHGTDVIFDRNGHGWHLDRARFDASLRAAAARAGVEVRGGARLTSAEATAGQWRISWAAEGGAGEVCCEWLVDASGRCCAVARRQGARRLHDDSLVGFFAPFRATVDSDRDSRTLIEAAPDGWWYTALIPSGERMVVFLTDPDLVDRSLLLSPRGFVAALERTEHLRAILAAARYEILKRPRGAGAGSASLDKFAGPGWLAAGDAALALDPLSSQGIFNALYTGLKAGQAVHRHLAGDTLASSEYCDRLEEIHRAYQHNRSAYYSYEQRWPDRPFWQRRRMPGVTRASTAHPQSTAAGCE